MINLKKVFAAALSCLLIISLAACNGNTNSSSSAEESVTVNSSSSASSDIESADASVSDSGEREKLSVVATIFPPYDFTREIAGDNITLTMLLPPGSESHSYEPTPQDIITIQECDVFIYTGGESDTWVDTILESMDTSTMKILKMMDMVNVVEEEIVEGMEDDEHDHSHGAIDFEDSEVEDRELTDWAGEWQSVYPYLLDGSLDTVMDHKAEEDGEMTADEYYEYYSTGYETDVGSITITDTTMAFTTGDTTVEAGYEYAGYEILTYESGSKGVRYMFESTEIVDGAPRFVQFSDHEIGPTIAEHFHIYCGDESQEALWDELTNWPTYYPADDTADDIVEDMLGHEDEEEVEYDEHVWTSPVNAQLIVSAISEALTALDPDNADIYEGNTQSYIEQLQELDDSFHEVVDNAQHHTIIFGDRFPLRYFADEYGLDYYAAFPGCSTETEASAATVAFLIDKVKEENIPVVFYIEFSNEKMCDTICAETDATKLLFHSCHNVSTDDIEAGTSYLGLMRQNVTALEEALK